MMYFRVFLFFYFHHSSGIFVSSKLHHCGHPCSSTFCGCRQQREVFPWTTNDGRRLFCFSLFFFFLFAGIFVSSELYDILRASIVCYRHSRDVVPWATNDGRCCILFVFVLFCFFLRGYLWTANCIIWFIVIAGVPIPGHFVWCYLQLADVVPWTNRWLGNALFFVFLCFFSFLPAGTLASGLRWSSCCALSDGRHTLDARIVIQPMHSTAVRYCPPQKRDSSFPCTDWLTSPGWPWYKLALRGVADLSLMRTHIHSYARSEYHTQLTQMSFDEIFDLTAGVISQLEWILIFYNKYYSITHLPTRNNPMGTPGPLFGKRVVPRQVWQFLRGAQSFWPVELLKRVATG